MANDLMTAQTTGQNVEPTSGPEQDGPIWGYHFVPDQPARSISSEAAVQFLTAPGPPPPDEFLWLHFFAFQCDFGTLATEVSDIARFLLRIVA